MPTKLVDLIAQVAIAGVAENGCDSISSELIAAASKVVAHLTPAELARFPKLWYPPLSAKAAGAPDLKDGWERLWFEGLVEILYQSGSDGLPVLFELLERDGETYHSLVVVRLLRFAAANVRKKAILDKVKARLPELEHGEGPETVEEVMFWAAKGDLRLSKLLKSMAKVKLKGIGEVTVGSVMEEWAESRGIHL